MKRTPITLLDTDIRLARQIRRHITGVVSDIQSCVESTQSKRHHHTWNLHRRLSDQRQRLSKLPFSWLAFILTALVVLGPWIAPAAHAGPSLYLSHTRCNTTISDQIVNGSVVDWADATLIDATSSSHRELYYSQELFTVGNSGDSDLSFALNLRPDLGSHSYQASLTGSSSWTQDFRVTVPRGTSKNFWVRFAPIDQYANGTDTVSFASNVTGGSGSITLRATVYSLYCYDSIGYRSSPVGQPVQLQGQYSWGWPFAAPAFRWSFLQWPAGSAQPTFDDPNTRNPKFTPQVPGSYVIRLKCQVPKCNPALPVTETNPYDFLVTAEDTSKPELYLEQIFIPNGPRRIQPGDTVDFGTVIQDSTAPRKSFTVKNIGNAGLQLTSANVPVGVSATPLPASIAAGGLFSPWEITLNTISEVDLNGNVQINNNSSVNPFSFHLTGRVVRLRANAGPDYSLRVPIGGQVSVDGSASLPLNDPSVTFSWSFVSRPSGSTASFANANAKNTSFVPDVSGDYVVQLTVGLAGSTNSDTATLHVRRGQTLAGSIGVASANPLSPIFGRSPGIFFSSVRRGVELKNTVSGETKFASADVSTGHYEVNDIADGTYSVRAYSHDAGLNSDGHFISETVQTTVSFGQTLSPIDLVVRAKSAFRETGTIPISVVELVSQVRSAKTVAEIISIYFTGGAALIPELLAEEAVEYLVEEGLKRAESELIGNYEIEWVTANTWNPQTGAAEAIVQSERAYWVRPGKPRETFFERTSKDAMWITAHSPVSLVIEDPSGRRLGRDGLADVSYFDLLGGYEEAGDEKNLLLSEQAVAPFYRLYVYGLDSGTYSLDVQLFRDFPVASLHVTDVPTAHGQVDIYFIGSPLTSTQTPALRRNQAPTIPGPITASNVTYESALVTWGSANDPDGDGVSYEVEYGENGNVYRATITPSTFANLTGLKPQTTYSVQVRARDAFGGVSAWREASPSFTTLSCGFAISVSNPTPSSAAGSGFIQITTSPFCDWTISADVPWITMSQSSGRGSATITYAITANPMCLPRTGVLTIEGLTFTVTQAGKTEPGVIYVSRAYSGTYTDGSSQWPFRTVAAGLQAACSGDTLRIFGGNYAETFISSGAIQKNLFMERWERPETPSGDVIIGQ